MVSMQKWEPLVSEFSFFFAKSNIHIMERNFTQKPKKNAAKTNKYYTNKATTAPCQRLTFIHTYVLCSKNKTNSSQIHTQTERRRHTINSNYRDNRIECMVHNRIANNCNVDGKQKPKLFSAWKRTNAAHARHFLLQLMQSPIENEKHDKSKKKNWKKKTKVNV